MGLLSDFLHKFGGKLKFGVKVNVRKELFDEPAAFCHLTRATRQQGGRSIELQVAPLQTDKKYPWTIRMKKYIKMHYRNEERSMKAIVVEAKSIARRTIANEKKIRISWCEEWRWIISKRSWLAQQQVFIFALKIYGNMCVCHQCRKVSNKDEIKMRQSNRGCEENLIGFCSCTSRKMICFWQLCRSCQQNASLSKINDGGGVWRQSLVKYWTRMSYKCKFSAQWMISALLSLQNVDENFIKNESSLSLLLNVICMRMRAVWWFHSLVEGLHGVSRLLSKSSSLPIGPFDIL